MIQIIMKAASVPILLALLLALASCQTFTSTAPTWITDPTFQAGSSDLVFVAPVSAPLSQSYSVSFKNAAQSNPPIFSFGIKTYRANDYLVQEGFRLTTTGVIPTVATVLLELTNITTIHYLSLSFIVVETTLTYNMHFIPAVDLNYSSTLANITTMSSSLTSHTEIVDFSTSQVYFSYNAGYQTFTSPLTNNKILFFLSALNIVATSTSALTLDFSYSILTNTSYEMTLTVGYNVSITRVSFNQIFYDTTPYTPGLSPYLNAYVWDVTDASLATNQIQVDSVILNNQFVTGLASFAAVSGQATLQFWLVFATFTNGYGSKLNPSVPVNTSLVGISSCKVSVFYMMTYTCPVSHPYLNLTVTQCQDACGFAGYVNTTDSTCRSCTNTICLACNQADPSACTSCLTNYQISNNTCVCDTATGYLYLVDTLTCIACWDIVAQCTSCSYTGAASAAFNSSLFICIGCNNSAGYYINASDLCEQCSISNCVTCSGLSQCSVCASGYGVTAAGLCSTCPVTGCTTCLNLTYCSVCASGITPTNGACQTCSQTCTCDGYTLPYLSNGDCSTICGDGIIIFPYEACDDGNTLSGDGCSSSCVVEDYSTCGGTPSSCFLNRNIAVSLVSTVVSETECNQVTFVFEVVPQLLIFDVYPTDWTSFLSSNNTALTYLPGSLSRTNGQLTLTYSYSQTIQNQAISFTVNPVGIVNSSYLSTVSVSVTSVTVRPSNNLAAVYCDEPVCNLRVSTPRWMAVQSAVAYIGLAFSLFSMKIAGLEMFGLVQLNYFILSDYDYVNPLMIGMLGRKEVNGINVDDKEIGNPAISARVLLNGITSERFLSDFNVMFYIMIAIFLIGLFLYTLSYLLNKYLEQREPQDQDDKQESLRSESLAQESQRAEEKSEPSSVSAKLSTVLKISKYLMKEVLVTFLLFNLFNLGFSAGLQILYIYNVNSWDMLCLLFSLALTLGVAISQFVTDRQEFGEYKNKFKTQRMPKNYVTASIVFRFTLGLLMALLNEWSNSGIIFVLLGMFFLGFIFAFDPFLDPLHNTRSKVVHSVYLLVLVVYYFYRKETVYNQVSANEYLWPAYVQLAAVGITVILSTVFLGYELVKKVKERFCKAHEKEEGVKNEQSQAMDEKQNEDEEGQNQEKEKQREFVDVQALDN